MSALVVVLLLVAIVFFLPLSSMFLRHPAAFLTIHLAVVCFVPYWIGISVGGNFFPAALFSTLLLLSLALRVPWPRTDRLDVLLCITVAVALLSVILNLASLSQWLGVMLTWVVPFWLGRRFGLLLSVAEMSRILLPFAALLASWSMFELLFDWHPFVHLTGVGGPGDVWASIQYRGGLPRSEGAFGTSIVLGNVLALIFPFVLVAKASMRTRLTVGAMVVGGILATFSRNALIAVAVALILASIQLRRGPSLARRVTTAVLATGLTLMMVGVYVSVTADFASDEIANSTQYRQGYLSLFDTLQPLGPASSLVEYAPGKFGYSSLDYIGGVAKSIDSSAMLVALQFGWLPAVLLVALLLVVVVSALGPRGRLNPSMIAVAALVPSVLTVAMVTQLPYLYWLFLGIAVSTHRGRSAQVDSSRKFFPTYHPPISREVH